MNERNRTGLYFFGTFIFGIIIGFIWSSAISSAIVFGLRESSTIAKEPVATKSKYKIELENQPYEQSLLIKGKIINIHDGDTVTVRVSKDISVRLLDCWAPEINSKDEEENKKGLASKQFLSTMLNNDDEVTVEIPLYDNLSKSLTFGRFLGNIWRDINGDGVKENISNEMVKNNYATKRKNN